MVPMSKTMLVGLSSPDFTYNHDSAFIVARRTRHLLTSNICMNQYRAIFSGNPGTQKQIIEEVCIAHSEHRKTYTCNNGKEKTNH